MSSRFFLRNQIVRCDVRQTSDLYTAPMGLGKVIRDLFLTCVSNRLQSIQVPTPVCWREMRAAIMAPCAYNAVERSVTATPTLQGGPSGSPVLGYGK